ncbi:MAG TPA: helix-turn-helix domain-containing protein [Myxococcota bacterium]|nr:helix-turn-helix domain-containing protein [Myxococcota bacterium]
MPQPPITRDRILDTAEALFAERGFAGTAVRDIASAVDLTAASLYNHFAGKEALYAAVLERGLRPLIDVLEDLAGHEHERSALDATLGRAMAHLARRPNVARLIYHEALTGAAHLVPLTRTWIQPILARALGEMKREVGSPWLDEEHRRVVAMWLQLVAGYFAVAPLIGEVLGEDPLAPETVDRQTRFLRKLARLIMGAPSPEDTKEELR